jgi:hypothetical protein
MQKLCRVDLIASVYFQMDVQLFFCPPNRNALLYACAIQFQERANSGWETTPLSSLSEKSG